MKVLFLILSLLISLNLYAGTCSSISYTSSSANSTLTSTKYNTDNTTVYNFVNAYDAGCVTSATLEKDSLDATVATGFAVPLNGIVDGCKVTKATAATLTIGNCIAAVNNNWIKTATPTTIAWTAIDTGAEAASTFYYVYIDSTSNTTTLTPVISITAPGTDGLNGSDRALAKFWNDKNSDIATPIEQWNGNEFRKKQISVRYSTGNGDSITNASYTTVNYSTKANDDFALVASGTQWVFLANRDDKLTVSAKIKVNNIAWDAGEVVEVSLNKNGVLYDQIGVWEANAAGTFTVEVSGTTEVDVSTNDNISVSMYQNSGGTITLAPSEPQNNITITSTGD